MNLLESKSATVSIASLWQIVREWDLPDVVRFLDDVILLVSDKLNNEPMCVTDEMIGRMSVSQRARLWEQLEKHELEAAKDARAVNAAEGRVAYFVSAWLMEIGLSTLKKWAQNKAEVR